MSLIFVSHKLKLKLFMRLVEYIVSSNVEQLCKLWLKRSNNRGCTQDKAGQSISNKRAVVCTKNGDVKV